MAKLRAVYALTENLDAVLAAGDPARLCVVEESPDWPGELVFQAVEQQGFYQKYREWVSRYGVLNEVYMLGAFVDRLREDGWHPVFLPSCRPVLEAVARWSEPLDVDGLAVPGGGRLYPYQSFTLRRALERATAGDGYWFFGWGTGSGKSLAAAAGAQELFNRGEAEVVVAFTLRKLRTNLQRYFSQTTGLNAVVCEGTPAKRKAMWEDPEIQVYVTNYDKAYHDFDHMVRVTTERRPLFVLDEVQKVLTDGKRTRARQHLDEIVAARRPRRPLVWPMSASVVSTSPLRYRDVFSLVPPGGGHPLGTRADFEDRYAKERRDLRITARNGRVFTIVEYDWDLSRLQEVRHRVADRAQHVRKTDPGVRDSFKGMQTVVVPVQMSDEDRDLYEAVSGRARQAKEAGEGGMAGYFRLLRYICNTPEALLHTSDEYGKELAGQFPDLVTSANSAKMEMFLDQVEAIRDAGDKAVVFSYWTNMTLFILARALKERGISHVTHYGTGMTDRQAQQAQDTFKSDPGIAVFLSSDAGAYGLNLPEARYVINYECPYSYDVLMQRGERINRADSYLDGLTSYVYVTDRTVEERIWSENNRRRELAASTLGTTESLSYGEEPQGKELDFLIFGGQR